MVNIRDILNISDNLKEIKSGLLPSEKNALKHVAVVVDGTFRYAEKNKINTTAICETKLLNVKNIIKVGIKENIPILSFFLLSKKTKEHPHYDDIMCSLSDFFQSLSSWEEIKKNQVKINVIGKWYDLSHEAVEGIKKVIDNTKEYDKFFINFCVNYDGQEEILDSVRIIAKQILLGKITDPSQITKEVIKENLSSSYFIPPDGIILTGNTSSPRGFLLWDSFHSKIYDSGKDWPEFTKNDFLKGLTFIKL